MFSKQIHKLSGYCDQVIDEVMFCRNKIRFTAGGTFVTSCLSFNLGFGRSFVATGHKHQVDGRCVDSRCYGLLKNQSGPDVYLQHTYKHCLL